MINVQFGFRRLNTEFIRGLKSNKDWKFSKILIVRFRKKFKSSDLRKSFFKRSKVKNFKLELRYFASELDKQAEIKSPFHCDVYS